jgi:hypothetical protein
MTQQLSLEVCWATAGNTWSVWDLLKDDLFLASEDDMRGVLSRLALLYCELLGHCGSIAALSTNRKKHARTQERTKSTAGKQEIRKSQNEVESIARKTRMPGR